MMSLLLQVSSPLSSSEAKAIETIVYGRSINIQTKDQAQNADFSGSVDNGARVENIQSRNLLWFLGELSMLLKDCNEETLALIITEVIQQATRHADFGGYHLEDTVDKPLNAEDESSVLFLLSAYTEAMRCAERSQAAPRPIDFRPKGRRGMTIAEKILAMHEVSHKGYVRPGEIVQLDVDWILASELSWAGMENVYDGLGRPGIFRNDRFWLAGDHRVEPELYDKPMVKSLMQKSEQARDEFKMTEFQGFNYTIMHTEFVRSRAQPGMLCIGADSHSCSAGAVSCLSIGMGVTDVCIPLVTGQTWLAVPEIVQFRLVGRPPWGIGGKDIILDLLGRFKRNTVAADRVVEFTGPGVRHLSCDARFAIANMCTEFGAVTGIFESDLQTWEFLERRPVQRHKSSALYFKADKDAEYAATFEIDLSKVQSFVALYPSPDNVVPIGEVAGTHLDGTFIGACTTAEEDLIIGAMVLSVGLDRGQTPVQSGRRVVVPGSKPIRHKMEKLGLLDVYRRAGFKVGVPGCSMCVGQGVDQAAAGEKWLSSQNRNFKNRMGPGSIANLASAATVAASSFDMQMTDPRPLLDAIDPAKLHRFLSYQVGRENEQHAQERVLHYHEPFGTDAQFTYAKASNESAPERVPAESDTGESTEVASYGQDKALRRSLRGRVMRLGDFIDTDAIAPSKFVASCRSNEELNAHWGSHCMEFFMPEFRDRVSAGQNIIVAGKGFGCGSSRDIAVNALRGAGVQCVIAKSFAFIYARNQFNLGLLGLTIEDEDFYELAQAGQFVEVDMMHNEVKCGGRAFGFSLSDLQRQLVTAGGLTEAFQKYGKHLFDEICCRPRTSATKNTIGDIESLAI